MSAHWIVIVSCLLLTCCDPGGGTGAGGGSGGGVVVVVGGGGGGGGTGGGGGGGDATGGGGGSGVAGVDYEWAQWPAPPDAPPASNYQVGGGIVTDSVTGLKWQQITPTSRFTRSDAEAYCDGLSLGGIRWRLPTLVELASIVGYGRVDPAIDESIFPNSASEFFWSSTLSSSLSTHGWVVDLMDGSTTGKEKSLDEHVRCVACSGQNCASATAGPGAPAGRYTVSADLVLDTVTNLTWQRNPPSTNSTWAMAASACQNLTLNGSGWRLPTVKELQSLVDVRTAGAAIDPAAFPNAPTNFFWSSSIASTGWKWVVGPTQGTRSMSVTLYGQVRCVR